MSDHTVTLSLIVQETGISAGKIKMLLARNEYLKTYPYSIRNGGSRLFFKPFIEWLKEYEGVTKVTKPVTSVTEPRKAKLPSGAQLREMRLGLPQVEFMKRVDYLIGFSSKPKQEIVEVAPNAQGLLQFEEIKNRFTANKK